jgi:hypothetical protein
MDGWMDGVELDHRVAGSQMLKALLAFTGGGDEGYAPPFIYTLASAL